MHKSKVLFGMSKEPNKRNKQAQNNRQPSSPTNRQPEKAVQPYERGKVRQNVKFKFQGNVQVMRTEQNERTYYWTEYQEPFSTARTCPEVYILELVEPMYKLFNMPAKFKFWRKQVEYKACRSLRNVPASGLRFVAYAEFI